MIKEITKKSKNVKQNTKHKTVIKNLLAEELSSVITDWGFDKYRSGQLFHEIYCNRTQSFEEMMTLPIDLRLKLAQEFDLLSLKIDKMRKSVDGSIKFLFKLRDGALIEAVYMPFFDEDMEMLERVTLCISSMVGCSADCAFCATGKLGFGRNLTTAEIIDQVIEVERELGVKVNNLVFMGMGEPLLNFNNCVRAIDIFTDEHSKMFSRKRVTLSTVGITKKIMQLAMVRNPVKLAISLHATTNGFRDKIIPVNSNTGIKDLMDAVEFYYRETHMPITYEYIPFEGLNDTPEDARRLAKIGKRVPSRINLIPYNDISFTKPEGIAAELKPSSPEKIKEFAAVIRNNGAVVTIRDTFGSDIEAACGQLALSEGE